MASRHRPCGRRTFSTICIVPLSTIAWRLVSTRKACRWHGAIGFAGRRSSRAGRRQYSRTAMTPTRSMARSSCPIRSRTCGWNMCRTNPREFKPRSGGASAPRTTSSWSRASLMSLPQPPRKIRWNIAVLCSTNRRVPRRARSGRREVRLGPAPAERLRPRRVGAECVWQLHGAGRRGRGVQGRRRCGQAYHLRGRLRYRDQSQHHRGAGAKRHRLWSDRRPLRRDHAERRPGGTEQFRQLSSLAHQ